jgi:hypothetical protein
MKLKSTAGVWVMTLAIAAGAAATPAPTQTPPDHFQPYFAVRTIETLDSNGKNQASFYSLEERDSSGRTLTAHLDSPVLGGKLTQVNISDPVKVRTIQINYVSRTATVTQFPPGAADKLLPSSQPFASEDPNRSDLRAKMLNDFEVRGYTWTTNDPNMGETAIAGGVAGAAEAAATFSPTAYPVTHEAWWSPVLRLFLLTSARDGNGNQQIIRYDQIRVKEPTAEDFAIPAGFKVRTIILTPAIH